VTRGEPEPSGDVLPGRRIVDAMLVVDALAEKRRDHFRDRRNVRIALKPGWEVGKVKGALKGLDRTRSGIIQERLPSQSERPQA
jgi:hypothetical protein